MKKINKNAFTLIELLAVIIILGILMIIAIPSVTSYINNSRKSAYVDSAKEIIAGARNFVNEGKVPMYDTSATYYIKASCISTENGQKSPYGEFVDEETFVIVTYDGNGYEYYWVSRDATGQGVPTPTALKDLDEDDIQSDIALGTIIPKKISDDKANVQVINATCNGFESVGEGGSLETSTFRPIYFGFGEVNTLSPSVIPEGKNIFLGLDVEQNRGVCIIRKEVMHCFKPNNTLEQFKSEILSVFSDVPIVSNIADGMPKNRIIDLGERGFILDAPDFSFNPKTKIWQNGNDSCIPGANICCDQGRHPSFESHGDNIITSCN